MITKDYKRLKQGKNDKWKSDRISPDPDLKSDRCIVYETNRGGV